MAYNEEPEINCANLVPNVSMGAEFLNNIRSSQMGMIDGIRNGITNLSGRVTGKGRIKSQDNPYYDDAVSLAASKGMDAMQAPGLQTFENYANAGKPYLKAAKRIAPSGTPERILAETALSASGESGRYGAYSTTLKVLYAGINGPLTAALATTGAEAMLNSNFKSYQQGVDSGKPFLKAIKEHAKSNSLNGIVTRAALNASGEAGKYGAYQAALKNISNGLPYTEIDSLAKTGFDAMNDSSLKVYKYSLNAGQPFLSDIVKRSKRGSVENILARTAMKPKDEVAAFAASITALKHIFIGTGKQNTLTETLAEAGLEAMSHTGATAYRESVMAAIPFMEAIRDNSPKNSQEYAIASAALQNPPIGSSYFDYQQALDSLKPKPKPAAPEGPMPLDFLEEKKKEITEGKKDEKELRIKILEDSVNIGGVTLKRSKRD